MQGGSFTSTVDSFLPIFPNLTTRRLRYTDKAALSSVSGVLSSYSYTLSGLYDPNITGTGHQPMGFDEIMTFYEHYHVLTAKVHVTFQNVSAGNGYVCLKISPDSTPPPDPFTCIEEGRNVVDFLDVPGSTNCAKVLRATVNVPGVMGLNRRNFLADTDTGGAVSSNPAEQTYLHLCAWAESTLMQVAPTVVIEYTAVFTEPRNLTASRTLMSKASLESKAPRSTDRPRR